MFPLSRTFFARPFVSLELRVQFCLLVCCTYPSLSTVKKEKKPNRSACFFMTGLERNTTDHLAPLLQFTSYRRSYEIKSFPTFDVDSLPTGPPRRLSTEKPNIPTPLPTNDNVGGRKYGVRKYKQLRR